MHTIRLSYYLILKALAQLPYEQSGAVIQNILEQQSANERHYI